VMIGNRSVTQPTTRLDDDADTVTPGFFVDTEIAEPPIDSRLAALRALRLEEDVTLIAGDDVSIAVPLYVPEEDSPVGVLVAERRLTEVTTAVNQVRNALLAASAAGLLVAIALGVALSSTLLRRLARLRATALRITAEGPDAPVPRDDGRDEVGDLGRTLARMQEELRRQEAARRSFVATASHELRTPLTMLQGTMELLEEDLQDERLDIADAQLQVTNARRELRRLSALAGELLDLSRLDAAVQLRSEPIELGELARAVAAEFHLRASERAAEIDAVPPADGCWGRGDPDAVARVVRILIDNALRYGPAGQSVTVETICADGVAGLAVSDRGPGIPSEESDHIFERFHRGRAAGSESGFGLGLAIGRELAERMGGTLRLGEREGPGACFVLTLPAAEHEGAPPPRPARDVIVR
jgi:signal transduction histidine kinase